MLKKLLRSASPSVQAFLIIFSIFLGGVPVFLLIQFAPKLKIWFLILYFVYLAALSLIYAALIIPSQVRKLKDMVGEETVYEFYPILRFWDKWERSRQERRALRHPFERTEDDAPYTTASGEPDYIGLFLRDMKRQDQADAERQ